MALIAPQSVDDETCPCGHEERVRELEAELAVLRDDRAEQERIVRAGAAMVLAAYSDPPSLDPPLNHL